MATVFLALDLALDRKVAIKVMSPALASTPGSIERFRREARTAAALSHPHIVPIFAIGEEPGIAYYVMKYIEGRGLDSVLQEDGAQSPAFVQAILSYVGTALQHAHEHGVVHRDVKPANIMLDRNGWTYVTDFGIAKREDGHGLTQSGMIIGTPNYMCPEQFNGAAITGAADQYALGIVAYEMLAGKTPYDGPSLGEVMRGHLLEPVPRVRLKRPDVPEALDACVTRMLAKDPADRFPDLAAAVAAIGIVSATAESEARTSIIKLARASDATRPRISVPQSPTPAMPSQAPPRPAPQPTVRTPIAARQPTLPPQAPPVEERSGGSTFFRIFVLLLVVLGIGVVGKQLLDAERQRATVAVSTVPVDGLSGNAGAGGGATGGGASAVTRPPLDAIPFDSAQDSAATSTTAPTEAPPSSAPAAAGSAATTPAAPADSVAAPERDRTGNVADNARRPGAANRAIRERVEDINDRREAAGQSAMQLGLVRIGTTGPRYTVFVNGRARQVISGQGLHDVPVPVGSVTLSLRAMNCISWDTVITVRNKQVYSIGDRSPHC